MNTLALSLGLVAAFSLAAANWPQFRGPQASGVESNVALPARWDIDRGENAEERSSTRRPRLPPRPSESSVPGRLQIPRRPGRRLKAGRSTVGPRLPRP